MRFPSFMRLESTNRNPFQKAAAGGFCVDRFAFMIASIFRKYNMLSALAEKKFQSPPRLFRCAAVFRIQIADRLLIQLVFSGPHAV